MAAVGAPACLADVLDLEDVTPVGFEKIVKIVTPMVCKKLKRPDIDDRAPRNIKIPNLNLEHLPAPNERARKSCQHYVDIIMDVQDDFDRDEICALRVNKN